MEPLLPCKELQSSPDLRGVSPQTVADLVTGKLAVRYVLIDGRFEYEYKGGHIRSAVNLSNVEAIEEFLQTQCCPWDSTAIIFHCEYSSQRGPWLCRRLRQHDRLMNLENYPVLTYPQVYLMEGGYNAFFKAFAQCCEPEAYVPMRSEDLSRVRREFKKL